MIIQLYYNKENTVLSFASKELGNYLSRMLLCTVQDAVVASCAGTASCAGAETWIGAAPCAEAETCAQPGSGTASQAEPLRSEGDKTNAANVLSIRLLTPEGAEDIRDRFQVHIQKGEGFIQGSNSRSVLLGVYHYLRTLGCRFLGPGRKYEVVPSIKEEQLYLSYTKKASFRHRGACIEGANSLENVMDFVDWLPKLGYNSFFLQFSVPYTFLARWYSHENNPRLAKESAGEPYTAEDAAAHTAVIESAMAKRGLLLHKVGHGWTGSVLGYSSVAWQAEDRPLTEEQREMTAQLQGVRGLYHRVPLNTNLCYSNPRAIDTFVRKVTDYASEHPEVSCLHIWLADDSNNICECENCRRTTPSDQYISLLNRIDEALTAGNIPTKLVFLLYQELLWPPIRERLHNPDRFLLMFAPISRTFEASYDLNQDLPPIPPYRRNRISLPTSLSENLSFLRGWQKTFSGDSFVYDYHLGRAHYGDLGYVHISRIAGEDIRKLHEMGLNGMISCQELRAGLPNFLPNYVMGHTLFDEGLSFDQLMEEYYRAAYGKDYRKVMDYLSRLSDLSSCDYVNGKGSRQNPDLAERFQEILRMAEGFQPVIDAHRIPSSPKLADNLPGDVASPAATPQKSRWETPFWGLLSHHRRYVLLLSEALFHMAKGENKEAYQSWLAFRDYICRMEPEFQEALDVFRVTEITGNHAGLKRLA